MRASMHADGTTFRPRHTSDPAGTEDPDGREELGGGPHRDVVGASCLLYLLPRSVGCQK